MLSSLNKYYWWVQFETRLNYYFFAENPLKLQVKHKNFESFKINCDSYSYIYIFEL